MRILDKIKSLCKLKKQWRSSDISCRPHMEDEGLKLLENRFQTAKVYLEYGAGGSTVLAALLRVEVIHSIDSDLGFLCAVENKVAECKTRSKISTYYVDIGPTKEWGVPSELATASRCPRYCIAAWDEIRASARTT